MLPAIKSVIEIITDTANDEILPRFRNLSDDDVLSKGDGDDVVTAADIISEDVISGRLLDLLPGSVVVGEESAYKDKNILTKLSESSPVWIIDPIDGTCNYAQGNANFSVIVALQIGREIVAGWIYNPIENSMATAEKGAGAWINGEKVNIAAARSLSNMVGATFGRNVEINQKLEDFANHIDTLHSRGCVGNEFINMIRGDIHFMVKDSGILPWDYAAGVMMHNEAGGYSAMFDDSVYDAAQNYTEQGILLAPDRESWNNIFNCYMHGKCAPEIVSESEVEQDDDES
ncbi:MAG: inositol monophosphatase [Alphaproteobacteria bacterium]|nr:inositol monophosphatase [Alphaproteobacteria bacterium]